MRALLGAYKRIFKAFWATLYDIEFVALSIILVLLIVGGSMFFHFEEGWNWLDSTYFTIITLTTLGYGDFLPATQASKVFISIYSFLGIAILLGYINIVSNRVWFKMHDS